MQKGELEIRFDMDALRKKEREKMENDLDELLNKHGWTRWASGSFCRSEKWEARIRDISYERKEQDE